MFDAIVNITSVSERPFHSPNVLPYTVGTPAAFGFSVASNSDGSATVRMIATQFAFVPRCLPVPQGRRVTIRVTSPDVIHGFIIERVLKTVPQGALALTGIALGLLMVAWLAIYFFVFLPRGPIG